ncbi:hypothetical protein [Peredibacter starrii]|uniref:Peptidase M12A domain-containing protein n=1 Tax=Peredibacter starrii TaxID=28202 RepID=A0AAX4HQS7_9BACT|nr:hypothetical protein [Peredibacter starrii]WPU65557.1 hypothetical protein SOO65_02230 [Peredibacter starrii]
MKVLFLIMGVMLIHSPLWAKGFIVNWSCPADSSEKISVEVFYDESGKLIFEPEIFSEIKKEKNVDYSKCINDFQKKISTGTKLYQEKKCPQAKDSFCASAVQYTNLKVLEKIRGSYFMKKFRDVRVLPIEVENTPVAKAKDPTVETETSPVSSGPDSAEAFLDSMVRSKVINPKELNRIFTFQNKSYRVGDFDQVIGKNIDMIFSGSSPEEGKQFAQNYMVAKSEYLKEGSDPVKRKAVLDNLNQMFGKIYGSRGPEELAKMLECDPDDNLTPIGDILNKLQSTRKVEGCKQLSPGEHKVFEKDNGNYYSTGDYLLKRKKDGNYQAFVNVNFKRGSGSVSPEAMMQRSKECLQEASPYMKGPDGTRIEMMVFSPSELEKLPKEERPDKKDITIERPGARANAGAYPEDIPCATIVHEMLHLLGLCDEYEEKSDDLKRMWNCRVVPKADSIMRNSYDVYPKAVAQEVYCKCDRFPCSSVQKNGDENAKKMLLKGNFYDVSDYKFRSDFCRFTDLPYQKNMKDPLSTALVQSESSDSIVIENRTFSGDQRAPNFRINRTQITCTCNGNKTCLAEKSKIPSQIASIGIRGICPGGADRTDKANANLANVIKFKSEPTMPSLLQPNHFKKILAGNCRGVVDGYLECADWAYKGRDKYSCNAPAKCQDDSYYLGTPQ